MPKNNKKIFYNEKVIPYNYIWSKENPISYITEGFQKFLANLEYVNVDKKYQIIQITSSLSKEGKSTFLSNIAFLLSQKGYKTIIVDLDLRKPKIHRIYNCENSLGVTDILAEKVDLDKAIKKNNELGFHAITAGEKTTAIINILESDKMKRLFDDLRKKYDYILIDSPPVINVSDALYIAKISDSVIFALSQKGVKRGIAREAVSLLKQNKIDILGIVMTQVDLKRGKYGYGYGYGYDYTYENKND